MGERPTLYALAIELTAHCNQKCAYCYNAWREDGGASVGSTARTALMTRLDRLLDAFAIDHVTLTGGEPFAHKDVFGVIERLHGAGVGVQMISNGGMITDAIAQKLSAFPIRYVQITLNAPEAALHDEHVGGEGHFDRTIAGIEALRRHGVPVVGCVVVTRKNARLVGAILARWRAFGVQSVALSRFSPAGYATSAIADLLPGRDDLHEAFAQAAPFARDHGMSVQVTMPVPPCAIEVERFPELHFGHCPIGTDVQELALGPDGRLRNCTLHGAPIEDVDVGDPTVDLPAVLRAPARTE
jgi:MoaA/NifB/PqqE/SkfB family radical SAM enzyme